MTSFRLFDANLGDVLFDASSIAQIMSSGQVFVVNETTGNDTYPGTSAQPLKTISAALAKCTANNGDQILIMGTVHVSATVVFNVDGLTVRGLGSASNNIRSRISQTGSTVFTPLVSVTASGCTFETLDTFHGFNNASAQVCWADSGGRNAYKRVGFRGGGHATAAAHTGCRSLAISGNVGEHTFDECVFGLDTIQRATAVNATLEFTGHSPRNLFRRCVFQMDSALAGQVHINVPSGGIDRYAIFEDCLFTNTVDAGGTTIDAAVTANASAGGSVILRRPASLGATALATTGPVYVDGSAQGATTTGILIKAT